ncbi:hypothetical protein SLA2020_048630 [Shorea laevis]
MSANQKPKVLPELPLNIQLLNSVAGFLSDSQRPNFTINRRLLNLLELKSPSSNKPINDVKSSNITVDASCNLWFHIYILILVFFHDGSFAFLATDSKPYDDFYHQLSYETHAVVISVNYQLSPKHRCPDQYEDGFDVLKFVDDNDSFDSFAGRIHKHCFLAGDSASANSLFLKSLSLLANE